MKKKLRLKKKIRNILIIVIILIIGIIYGINKYKEYKYHQTYEYKLLEHGYNKDEVTIIFDKWHEEKDYDFFLNNPKNSNYVLLTQEKYYLAKNFQKYLDYMQENPKLPLNKVVRNINIHLDLNYYEGDLKTDISKDNLLLVNKYYGLTSDYEPTDLVSISTKYAWGDAGSKKIRQVVYDAFQDMWEAANNDGYYLMINSAYRAYKDQETIYENYKKKKGKKYADAIAAHPGHSEHQTGLCLDIFSKSNSNQNTFKDTETAKWLKDNSYKYGFILRYPEDSDVNVTGFTYEAWHFRYVGIDAATYIYNNNITFEEYYAYYVEK